MNKQQSITTITLPQLPMPDGTEIIIKGKCIVQLNPKQTIVFGEQHKRDVK